MSPVTHQTPVQLNDLVGVHSVDGDGATVDENGQVFLLRIDGRIHAFCEDPADGYRSMLRRVEILADSDADVRCVTAFEPRTCHFAKYNSRNIFDDVLVVTDDQTGDVILEIGTVYSCLVPIFVGHWRPIPRGISLADFGRTVSSSR